MREERERGKGWASLRCVACVGAVGVNDGDDDDGDVGGDVCGGW